MKINSISSSNPKFPARLSEIHEVPQQLYIRGTLPDESRKWIAIVGTRKPTPYGAEITRTLARKLAEKGAVIVSGLALGVDGLAHQGALAAQGTAVAVLGGGVDDITPRTNALIGEQILASGGAILSEYEPGTPPRQHRFLERNRIVSGLCDALIVTEASLRSGTSNTVRNALEQGRDVYAVPGAITSPMSRGCNQLIAQGATPIIDIDAFIEELFPAQSRLVDVLAYSTEEQSIVTLIKQGIRDGDELQAKSQLEAGLYAQTLTMLELRGAIRPLGANQWSL